MDKNVNYEILWDTPGGTNETLDTVHLRITENERWANLEFSFTDLKFDEENKKGELVIHFGYETHNFDTSTLTEETKGQLEEVICAILDDVLAKAIEHTIEMHEGKT